MGENITLREAWVDDVADIATMLADLRDAGLRTRPCDPEFVRSHYVSNPGGIRCTLAFAGDQLCGLQALTRAQAGNPYGAPVGWGIIGTHVSPSAGRKGIGRALFTDTARAARDAGLEGVEAFIGADNAMGLGYYGAMGFETVREVDGAVVKAWYA
ncbi:MAG: GNAT family N-acetyltransferase [Pseudomonadota bacterium]